VPTPAQVRKQLAKRLTDVPDVARSPSMFHDDDTDAWWLNARQIAMFEDEELAIRLTRKAISDQRARLKTDDHVDLRKSGSDWIMVRVDRQADADLAYELFVLAAEANHPGDGRDLKPPPTGADLERRRKMH
jgi:luciferase-like monooxygenase